MTIAQRAARLAAICTFLAALTVASVCATGRAWAQPHGGVSAVTPEPSPPPAAAPPPGCGGDHRAARCGDDRSRSRDTAR
jgi:hypothetical protein